MMPHDPKGFQIFNKQKQESQKKKNSKTNEKSKEGEKTKPNQSKKKKKKESERYNNKNVFPRYRWQNRLYRFLYFFQVIRIKFR